MAFVSLRGHVSLARVRDSPRVAAIAQGLAFCSFKLTHLGLRLLKPTERLRLQVTAVFYWVAAKELSC